MAGRIEIPEGFPSRLTDDELSEFVDRWVRDYAEMYGDPSYHLPELKLAFMRMALEEQTRRALNQFSESSKRLTVALIVLTIVIAVFTVALFFRG
jgi:hypothetical protein